MKFDTSQKGLLTLFKPSRAALLEHIWKLNNPSRNGVTSNQAHKFLLDHPDKKSRASVTNSLNDMVDKGILSYEEESGKGGARNYIKELIAAVPRKVAQSGAPPWSSAMHPRSTYAASRRLTANSCVRPPYRSQSESA